MNQPYHPTNPELEEYIELWQTVGDVSYIHSLCQQLTTEPTPEAINDLLIRQGSKPRSIPRLTTMLHERQELIAEFHSPHRRPLSSEFPSIEAYERAYAAHREAKKAQRAAQRAARKPRRTPE